MAKQKRSRAGKGSYAAYRSTNRYSLNKKKKLERHLKKFSNDTTAKKCLERGTKSGFSYARKTPKVPRLTHSDRYHMSIWKEFGKTGKDYFG